jgi:hypothetical protein
MYARHPAIAKRWAKEYGVSKNLPEHSGAKRRKNTTRGDIRRAQLISHFARKHHG